MKKSIIYQVLTRLWGNGKFSDWTSKSFDYLKSLSVDYIWFTGIPRHSSPDSSESVKGNAGSPYAIENWFDTNPYLADNPEKRMAEFENLVARCHEAGFKVLIDFIPNHVSKNYSGAIPTFDYCDYDWTDTRKINYNDPMAVPILSEVLKFWALKGVDGFRCDMVELVPCDSMQSIISNLKSEFPASMFVAEIYGKENYGRYLDEVGFDLLYDKSGIYDIARSICEGCGSARQITWNWQSLQGKEDRMLNFLENHDEQRLASEGFAADAERGYAALAATALLNKASFLLYFGQELGENAKDSADGRTSIFNWTTVKSISHLFKHFIGNDGLSPKELRVLGRYRELLKLASSDVFANGMNWDLCYCQESSSFNPDKHFAFVRYDEKDAYLTLCNFSDVPADIELNIPDELIPRLPVKCRNRIRIRTGAFDYSLIHLQ